MLSDCRLPHEKLRTGKLRHSGSDCFLHRRTQSLGGESFRREDDAGRRSNF